jgi:hypothetical protein
MKKTIVFLSLGLLIACCASKKEVVLNKSEKVAVESNCPQDGKCDIELISNKTIVLKTDENSQLYYLLTDDNTKNVVIFRYNRNVPEGIQDATYREEIVIEIDKKSGEAINSKSLFGRFCFCKGQTGYYNIKDEITQVVQNDKTSYRLKFKIQEVPQIINELNFVSYSSK